MHNQLLSIYHTSWKVLLTTVKPILFKQNIFVQKTSSAIVKSFKPIIDDVSL